MQRDKVEKYLAKIQLYDRIIETKRETIARLEIQAVGSSPRLSADKVQTSKRYDRMGDAATEIVMIRESIDRYLKSKKEAYEELDAYTNLFLGVITPVNLYSNVENGKGVFAAIAPMTCDTIFINPED